MTLLFLACADAPPETAPPGPPFGMTLEADGKLRAGAARIEITPEIVETYVDADGSNSFTGCFTDPTASRESCNGETYDDVDGDKEFDGIWLAGYGSDRAAKAVHDPLSVSAVVISLDGEYVALVGVDVLGLLENRVRDTRDLLEAANFDRDRVIVSSSHSHSAPDTVGIYGFTGSGVRSGVYPPFVEAIPGAIYDAIEMAARDMVEVTPSQGAVHMTAPEMNSASFGGTNPNEVCVDPELDPCGRAIEGGMNDIRDPRIAADQVLAFALDGAEGRVATVVVASGHPEVSGSDHSEISADYPGTLRNWIDTHDGGTTVFLSGALGGMQSSAGGTLPVVDEAGQPVLDENGEPTWVEDSGWEFSRVYGTLIGQAAQAALTDTTAWDAISLAKTDYLVPVDNVSFKLAFQIGLLDTPDSYVVQDQTCAGFGTDPDNFGCVPASSWLVRLGPITLATFPGELMPELFWGVPDEPAMADASLRVGDRRWPQAKEACNDVAWEDCRDVETVGDCNCLDHHAAPYTISSDAGLLPVADMLPGTFKTPIGIANAYCGYIVPEPDFSDYVNVTTEDGDHYEETNSCSRSFGPLVQAAFVTLTGQ